MTQEQEQLKLKFWPSPQDYNEAVQSPSTNFADPDLQSGEVATDALGIPKPITGGFASVYRMHGSSHDWAIRCFLRDIPDAQPRYAKISDFVEHDTLPYTVGFNYQQRGIKTAGQWFPLLKMEWVDGLTLDNHVHSGIKRGAIPSSLAESFKKMTLDLQAAGIAHGDLQHGNIMVHNDELFLVDYDGMYVPAMDGWRSNELGHRNYQHPKRTADDFGPFLDNFSSWVIYTSLKALSIDPTLYEQLGAGDDCLLFRHDDFTDPLNSCAFNALEHHGGSNLRLLSRFIRKQLECAPKDVPSLDALSQLAGVDVPPLNADAPTHRQENIRIVVAAAEKPETTATTDDANTPSTHHWKSSYPELLNPSPRTVRQKPDGPSATQGIVFAILIAAISAFLFRPILLTPNMPYAAIMIVLAAIASVAWWALKPTLRVLKQKSLIQDGSPADGLIVSVTNLTSGKYTTATSLVMYKYKINYETMWGDMPVRDALLAGHHIGDNVTVLYNPANPKASLIYELAEYEAVV
ncbi:MAG TPA: DUF3592 domain-containing protein [Candidatus Obscuribacterales bacterium]